MLEATVPRCPDERPLASRKLVQQHTEREQIAAVVDGQVLQLLRRHVRHCPDDSPIARQRGRARAVFAVVTRWGGAELGDAEVEHLHAALAGQHDVGRLQVAVDDALLVGRRKRVGQCDADLAHLVGREAAGAHPRRQVFSLDQLHRDEAEATGLLDRVDRHDMGVVERGDGLGFPLEARERAGVGGKTRRQHLERHAALQCQVFRQVHLAHAAGAQLLDDAVMRERLASLQRQRWGLLGQDRSGGL
jgi:hypothetical protein